MGIHRWLFDELAHAGDEHLDPTYVQGYDRKAQFDPTPDVELLRAFGLGDESTLVDLGAGTGEFALAAARKCRRVVAVDISAPMVKALQAKAARAGCENLEAVRAGFLTYEHEDERPDFIYSRNALHHLPDFWKGLALERLAEMLRSGGVLRLRDLIFSCTAEESEDVIEAWLGAAPADPEEGWTRTELETHLRREFSTFSWLLEPMLQRAGFEIRDADYSESKVFASYVCVRNSAAQSG